MLSHGQARRIRDLHRRKGREEQGLFLAEGTRVVADLLDSEISLRVAFVAPALERGEAGRDLAGRLVESCRVERVADRELAELAATETPQGVVVAAETPRHELSTVSLGGDRTVVLVLDRIQDPGNLGTLVRTAEALGVAFVAVLPGTVDAWNPKAVRAGAGSTFRLPILQATWPELHDWLRVHAFTIYGADAQGESAPRTHGMRMALVVGNEGMGLSTSVRETVDALLSVPLRGRAESLNVGAAAAILLHSLVGTNL